MIKTTNYDQIEIIRNIVDLYCPFGITYDPTYSKGNFYKSGLVSEPSHKSDLYPHFDDVLKLDAAKTGYMGECMHTIMFDPPFLAGYTKEKPTGIIGERFHGFPYIKDLWKWYDECLVEFHRIIVKKGVLIIKSQDTVSSGKNWFSHVHLINKAEELGFKTKDLFVLLARNRMIGHNHQNQKHARKFHSYFLVFIK